MTNRHRHKGTGLGWLSGLSLLALAGCYGGVQGETLNSLGDRDIDQIPLPPDPASVKPIRLMDRTLFGAGLSAQNLAFQEAQNDPRVTELFRTDLPPEERMNPARPLMFFSTPHTDAEGAGPLFNQRMCLGCHTSNDDIRNNMQVAQMRGDTLVAGPATLNTISTPVSRAARQGPTVHALINKDLRPPTAAFTLYGDFFPQTGVFDPIGFLGGPLQHVKAVGECDLNRIPPESVDPNLRGGTDPVTGISPIGARREIGERAGPPYIGRGLIDSVFQGDIVANDDPADLVNTLGAQSAQNPNAPYSSLLPYPDPDICPGDCISGRHNENIAEGTGVPEEVFRVGRFGLRAAGVTMLQFDTGGTQGEIGLTSPFAPSEQNNAQNVGRICDTTPDPELKADVIRNLRSMIRMISPPNYAPALFDPSADSAAPAGSPARLAYDVQEGARLFGLDIQAFQSRVTPGQQPVRLGDRDADRAIAQDRGLGCANCHIPILRTGKSRANVGAEYISERWAPLFSDIALHQNPQYPFVRPDRIEPAYFPRNGDSQVAGRGYVISRNLADFAIPAPVTGIALGSEFRTPPLTGIGKTGAPFMHDARVYLNILPAPSPTRQPPYRDGNPPPGFPYENLPAYTIYTDSTGVNQPLIIRTLEDAILATIEIHDLPAPPARLPPSGPGQVGDFDYDSCPPPYQGLLQNDLCSRDSPNRSESRNVMEKFRQLTPERQMQVVMFLESL